MINGSTYSGKMSVIALALFTFKQQIGMPRSQGMHSYKDSFKVAVPILGNVNKPMRLF